MQLDSLEFVLSLGWQAGCGRLTTALWLTASVSICHMKQDYKWDEYVWLLACTSCKGTFIECIRQDMGSIE